MICKTIAYTDYDGNPREEKLYFHLNKAELTEMELSAAGGFAAMIQRIIDAKDGARIIATFKDLLLRSYGEKSPDGRRFIKSPELSKAFSETEAYSILFMELATDADKAAEFVRGVIPADLAKDLPSGEAAIAKLASK